MAASEERLADSGAQLASSVSEQLNSYPGGATGSDAAPAATAAGKAEEKPLPALFLDSVPEDADAHPDLAGLNTMMGELTAEERAENEKVPCMCNRTYARIRTAVNPVGVETMMLTTMYAGCSGRVTMH